MTLRKIIYADERGFDILHDAWECLVARTPFPSPFITCDWHRLWWQHFREGNLHLVAWFDEEELVGLAPFYISDGSAHCCLRPVGGIEIADYLDILAIAGREEEIYNAFLDHLESPDAPEWVEIELINLPEHTLTYRRLPQLAQERGWWAWTRIEDVCPVVPLPETFEEYLQLLDKKQRHEVRRKRRRLYRFASDVRYHVVQPHEDLQSAMDQFVHLHRRSHPDKAAFMTPQMEMFFRDLAELAMARGWLHLAFLEVNGEAVSTLLCFDYNDRRMVYNSGFEPEVAREISPGVNLVVMDIEDAIQQGLKVFDFLQGDETYKFRLGAIPTYVYRALLRREPLPPEFIHHGKTELRQEREGT